MNFVDCLPVTVQGSNLRRGRVLMGQTILLLRTVILKKEILQAINLLRKLYPTTAKPDLKLCFFSKKILAASQLRAKI